MGASGEVWIWRDDDVRRGFPDCDKLWPLVVHHYERELGGVKYHTGYEGDGQCYSWRDSVEYIKDVSNEAELKRLGEFIDFLNEMRLTVWEVWT